MNMTISQEQGKVPVTVIHIQGKLDGSNYKDLIAKAQELYQGGAQNMLIDLSEVDFMSSAGMVALHSIAKLLKGQKLGDEEGWSLLHSIDRERSGGIQKQLKLLNPQPRIAQALELAGFNQLFEIHQDLKLAIASY
jgi:anti-anti-sigma factor